jgi:two-component system sensor histidine kinase ChvG
MGQAELLETILEVLVDNAVGFSPVGGQVLVTLSIQNDKAVLTVADDGPGIVPERLDQVFERYYSDRPEGAAGQHFGIGLWLARQNTLAMGGEIGVENHASGGLCATVTLWAARAG